MFQLFTGLSYVHQRGKIIFNLDVVHRDLKPENVLFTEDERVKICDFGSSKFILKDKTKSTPYIVSRYYRAPELLLGEDSYIDKIDIFASGCIMAELLTLTPLFPGKSEGLQIFEQMSILGKPSKNYLSKFKVPQPIMNFFSEMDEVQPYDISKLLNKNKFYKEDDIKLAADLISKTICWEASERLSAAQALNHPLFKK
jgi:serine/threonine protein kinase